MLFRSEEAALPAFHRRLTGLDIPVRPIYIDNGSTDGSLRLLHSFAGAVVIEHATNEGYGASLRDGIRRATAERIVIIDADCEYPPEAIPEMVSRLDQADVVYASRFLEPQQTRMGWLKVFGNRVITRLFNLLFHQQLTDLYTGAKAVHLASNTTSRSSAERTVRTRGASGTSPPQLLPAP